MSIGHPGESQETILDTHRWLLAVKPEDFDVTIVTTYPGTPYGFWYYYFSQWTIKDPALLGVGAAATLFNIAVGVVRRDLRRVYLLSAALTVVSKAAV